MTPASPGGGPGWRSALGLLTVLGGASPPTPAAVIWFPLVGAGLGLVLGAWWWAVAEWWPPLGAAVLLVAADLALTGLLHVDGVADAADGLLPPLPAERRLAVMATPDVGAFGVGSVVVVLAARVVALATLTVELTGWEAAMLLGATWCGARTAMAVAVAVGPAARPGGLAAAFAGSPWWRPAVVAVPVLVGFLIAGASARTAGAVAAGALGAAAVVVLARRRIGGVTGDVLGAAGALSETLALVVATATWWS